MTKTIFQSISSYMSLMARHPASTIAAAPTAAETAMGRIPIAGRMTTSAMVASAKGACHPFSVGASRVESTMKFLRSEEHTSELQSRGHLVCRLLLEKKNQGH